MKQLLAAVCALLLATAGACADNPADSAAQPSQLRGFARDTLAIQRAQGRDTFRIWIADTPAKHQQGLMWVRNLAADQGMLFVLEAPRPMSMWMKNTYVPLDMLFLDATGRITHIVHDAEPLSEEILSSGGEVAGVLEIHAGEAQRRGIGTGDRVLHPAFTSR
jgi:uncharacterized membrane protein (UPF0127 family)